MLQHCTTETPFTPVQTKFCMDKNLHGSTLRLRGTGGTGRIFERLSVQVWDLKKQVNFFDRHGSDFARVNTRTVTKQLFAQIARLRPEI